jgi:hypothetical protein
MSFLGYPKGKIHFLKTKIRLHNNINYKLTTGWLQRALSYL